ncbi:alpha/beta hydrolase family protein [Deinococcus roseus]|uniref:Alpha/beta hydrolase n=1 Tax=Deinococcus roseus TaxID=392414 RepID=A0ABQ2DM35_9DEIO|nr:prolyl oligopeptidase family serine peptidase [Deinococcus roseus]GGJ58456.1 alpha/beta hydrolase [Deinococcus roseus]
MFKYFPTNYVWNIAINLALEMGAKIGEIDEMCQPVLDASRKGDDAGTVDFMRSWVEMADKLSDLAQEDLVQGRELSAGSKLARASTYYLTAERLQSSGFAERLPLYQKFLAAFQRSILLSGENCERLEIPYEGTHLSALYVRAEGVKGPAPVLVQVNGLDSTKEMVYRIAPAQALARRGVSSLILDQPGTGEALRLQGLTAVVDSERWASKVMDFLETRKDMDSKRIGLMGVSLGGYYAPRAVAFEPRFALGAVWGANHNWGEVQLRRLRNEGDRPVPHYWEHVQWVWGKQNMEEFMELIPQIHLNGILDRIRVPFLVTHGADDRQIPLDYAHQTYAGLVNSPDRELKIFTRREGGSQHSSLDNSSNAGDFIADWVTERLGGRTHTQGKAVAQQH